MPRRRPRQSGPCRPVGRSDQRADEYGRPGDHSGSQVEQQAGIGLRREAA
ncbi:MAG: hypothetical protein L0I24_18030 [Pseudonocardia sp.]|nr:hypothetical protein [Pseudonocardia sp.]